MRIERIEITPKMAEHFLSRNYDKQRHINRHWVQTIANDIKEGRWNPNVPNSAIVFSKYGRMIDGQHRCHAIMLANVPVRTYAIYDVDESVFVDIDNGISRTARDFIDCKNSGIVSTLSSFAVCIENGATLSSANHGVIKNATGVKGKAAKVMASREQVLDYYKDNKKSLERIASFATSVYGHDKLGSKMAFAKAMFVIEYVEGESSLAELFFNDLKADMQTTPATGRLVKTLMRMAAEKSAKRVQYPLYDQMILVLTAYDKFKEGKTFTATHQKKAANEWNNKIAIARMNKEKAEAEVN